MPKITLITLLLILTAALLTACGAAAPQGAPQIAPETTRLELGDVPNGQIITRDVVLRNDGDATLVVQDLSTSCGCTTATIDPVQIEPGQSATLHVAFDSGAHGPDLTGPMIRQVYVSSNDPAQPQLTVDLAVNVTPPLVGSN